MINIPNEVKELFKNNNVRKNFRISFPNGEHEDIINSELLADSVKLTESIFSSDFKFGLCEASVLQFETYDNAILNGYQIEAQLEVDVTNACEYITNTIKSDASGYRSLSVSGDGSVGFYTCLGGIDHYVYKNTDGEVLAEDYDVYDFSLMFVIRGTLEIYTTVPRDTISIRITSTMPDGTSYSEDIPYPFLPIYYGAFVVDSCKRSADSKTRTVVAYSNQVANNKVSDSFTLFATGLSGVSSTTVDAMKFVASNIPFFNMDLFSKTQVSLANETMINYSGDYGSWNISIETSSKRLTAQSGVLYALDYECRKLMYKNAYDDFCRALIGFGIPVNMIPSFDETWYKLRQVTFGDASMVGYLGDNPHAIYLPTGTDSYINIPYTAKFKIMNGTTTRYSKQVTPTTPKAYSCTNSTYMTYNHTFYKKVSSTVSGKYSLAPSDIAKEVPISSIAQSLFEVNAVFGVNDRGIKKFTLNPLSKYSGLTPSTGLNPSTSLNPSTGNDYIYRQSMYSSIWYDDSNSKPYGKVMCSFKDINDADHADRNYQANVITNVDEKGYPYKTYDFSSNYYVSNYAQSARISDTIGRLQSALLGFVYRPIDLDAMGFPFIEAGDWIDVTTNDESIKTYVARRTLSGIQRLVDSIEVE